MKLKHLSLLFFAVICFNNEIFAQIYSTGGFFGAGGNRISNSNMGGGGGSGKGGSVFSIGGSYSSLGEIDADSYTNFDGNGGFVKWRTGMWGAKAEYLTLTTDLAGLGEQTLEQLRYSAFAHFDFPNMPLYGEIGFGVITYVQEVSLNISPTPIPIPGIPLTGEYAGTRNFIPISLGVSLPLGSSISFDAETGMNYLLSEKIDGGGEVESVFAFSGIRGGFSFYF